LNRRGVLRFETALELSDIGSSQGAVAMKKAMSDFDAAIGLDPQRWRSWKSRGIALASQSKFAEAVNDFTKVIDLKPDEVDAWFNRAEAHYHVGNFESAVADYDSVLAMSDNDVEALTGRGHAYFSLGQYDEALVDYQNVATQVPNRSAAWINVGDAQQKLRQWKAVEDAYSKAMRLAPSSIAMQRMAWFKSTCSEATFRDPTGARDLIEQAIALAGESTTNLDTLAAVQAANGEFETAKQTQEKVIQLVEAQTETNVDSETVESFKTRLALYEEGESFRQERKTGSQRQQ
jgi:tetratricopeptide (TPR) repeat protein